MFIKQITKANEKYVAISEMWNVLHTKQQQN